MSPGAFASLLGWLAAWLIALALGWAILSAGIVWLGTAVLTALGIGGAP